MCLCACVFGTHYCKEARGIKCFSPNFLNLVLKKFIVCLPKYIMYMYSVFTNKDCMYTNHGMEYDEI